MQIKVECRPVEYGRQFENIKKGNLFCCYKNVFLKVTERYAYMVGDDKQSSVPFQPNQRVIPIDEAHFIYHRESI